MMFRSMVKLWQWNRAGRSLEDEEVKELNGQWLDRPHRKTMGQMPKFSVTEEE